MLKLICSWIAILLLLSGCGSETPTRHNDFAPLTSIEILAPSSSIAAHTSIVLSVTGNYSGLFSRDISDQVVWSSSAPTVAEFATAEASNRVTALTPGTAILTATVGNVSATFNLTVTTATITALTITPVAPIIAAGLKTQFAVNGTFSDATTQNLTHDVNWTSSTPNVATISDSVNSKGLAQALAVGTTTISAVFRGISDTALMTVTEVALQSITVTPTNPSILSISSTSFQAIGHYSDGSTADITSRVAWTSSKPDVATITTGGTAKTLAPGTANISASLNSISGSSNLKVTGGSLIGIMLSPTSSRLVKDTLGTVVAVGSFSNGSSRDITGAVQWTVANPLIAEVTTPGGNLALLNALGVTPASTPVKITASAGAASADAYLAVTAPLLESIVISPLNQELTTGTTGRFTAIAKFNDGTTQDVTANTDWTSGEDATASVDNTVPNKGRVLGVAAAAGSVTITAAYNGFTDKATVTVKSRTLATLTVSNSPAVTISPGNSVPFTAKATFSDGTSKDVTSKTTWTIDKANVAIPLDSLNQPGQVVAVDSGSATLTAAFDGKSQTITITVP